MIIPEPEDLCMCPRCGKVQMRTRSGKVPAHRVPMPRSRRIPGFPDRCPGSHQAPLARTFPVRPTDPTERPWCPTDKRECGREDLRDCGACGDRQTRVWLMSDGSKKTLSSALVRELLTV